VPAKAGTQGRQTLGLAALGPRLRTACAGATEAAAETICLVRTTSIQAAEFCGLLIDVFTARADLAALRLVLLFFNAIEGPLARLASGSP
jgi:hypothetical protein